MMGNLLIDYLNGGGLSVGGIQNRYGSQGNLNMMQYRGGIVSWVNGGGGDDGVKRDGGKRRCCQVVIEGVCDGWGIWF